MKKKVAICILILFLFLPISYAYEINYYHNDHLGSPAVITNQNRERVYSIDYKPFGQSFNEQGDSRFTYNSKEEDNTGLHYYGARYYDADIGRFITTDPLGGSNVYVYTRNNPLKYIDPSGKEALNAGTFSYPSYNGYTAGGKLDMNNLDLEVYKGLAQAAAQRGVDPYFAMAVSILETGGIREEGYEQEIAPDRVSQELGLILGVGREYALHSGVAGMVVGDALASGMISVDEHGNIIGAETPQLFRELSTELGKINSGAIIRHQSPSELKNPTSPLNTQSLILLKRQQERILAPGPSIPHRFQRLTGMGLLYHSYKTGQYPNPAFGIRGLEYPVNGLALQSLIWQLYNTEGVQDIIPQDAPTPVLNEIIRGPNSLVQSEEISDEGTIYRYCWGICT